MSSSYNGLDLFGSGPHRFAVGAQGSQLVAATSQGGLTPGSLLVGPIELAVIVTGRLIADKDEDLWVLRDAIEEQLPFPPTTADLIDHHGRAWSDMSFIRFEPADRTDRARVTSLAYTATFLRFLT